MKKNLLVFFIFFIFGLLLIMPCFQAGLFPAHDFEYHLNWSRHFADQLWAGELYPRWLSGMNGGNGSPVFFFYGPVPYFFTALFKPFFSGDLFGAWLRLGLSCSFALAFSGFTAFLWLETFTHTRAAVFGALLYMVLPYHLASDLFFRFAFAEFWSFVWLPLILLFARRIVIENQPATLGLACSYALLIMTHLPTTLIFSPIPLAYSLARARKGRRLMAAIKVSLAMVLGVGISAVYLAPALMNQDYVGLNSLIKEMFFYKNFFLISGEIYSEGIFVAFFQSLFWITTITAAISLCCFALSFRIRACRGEPMFWLFWSLVATFLMFPISKPIWETIPIIQNILFPYRFHVLLTIAMTALWAIAFQSRNLVTSKINQGLFFLTCLLVCSQVFYSGIVVYKLAAGQIPFPSDSHFLAQKKLTFSQGAQEYLPRWVPGSFQINEGENDLEHLPRRATVVSGVGNVEIKTWKPRHIILETNGKTEMQLTVGQFFSRDGQQNFPEEKSFL